MNNYISVLKKYAVFSGRASRKEYWMFFLFNIIVAFAFGITSGLLGGIFGIDPTYTTIFANIYQLAIIIPSIAVGVRRMHDTDKSGLYMIIPVYNFILALSAGTKGENKYGPDPSAVQTTSQVPIAQPEALQNPPSTQNTP